MPINTLDEKVNETEKIRRWESNFKLKKFKIDYLFTNNKSDIKSL